jgi:hypothetical protein
MRNEDSDLAGDTNEINETKCELNMYLRCWDKRKYERRHTCVGTKAQAEGCYDVREDEQR